jgi:hypothetical protein
MRFKGISGAFCSARQGIPIAAQKRASKRPQGQKKTPGNDNLSIIIPRRLSVEFIADT